MARLSAVSFCRIPLVLSPSSLFVVGLALGLGSVAGTPVLAQGVFTVDIGQSPPPPVSLVSHTDEWRYHKGTNAPVVGWQTISDALLGASWPSGRGGFGYAPNQNEVSLVQTLLNDMSGRYSMVYTRRTFEVTNASDPTARLILTMDWDDGFIAWLDGVYLSPTLWWPQHPANRHSVPLPQPATSPPAATTSPSRP